jgi:hypothetical protein
MGRNVCALGWSCDSVGEVYCRGGQIILGCVWEVVRKEFLKEEANFES